jgi:hypothetical protein
MNDENIIWGDTLKHQSEFNYLPAMLKKICYTAGFLARNLYGEKITTTSIFRKKTRRILLLLILKTNPNFLIYLS